MGWGYGSYTSVEKTGKAEPGVAFQDQVENEQRSFYTVENGGKQKPIRTRKISP